MEEKKEHKNWLEWSITIISAILVCFTLGYLIYQLIYEEETPPDIAIVLGEVSQKDGAFAMSVKALNEGTETAENVMIEITLDEGAEEEKAQITFAFLPGKSSAKGWIIFTKNPDRKRLKSRVKGYSTP